MTDFDVCDIITQRCASCLSSFLRGVFLASGRLSDPKKQFSLEFALGERCIKFKKILEDLSLAPLISYKKSGTVLYFRKGDEIESFYGHAGLNRVVFDIIETKIKLLARRESQRYLNCVTSNFDRMTAVMEVLKEQDLFFLDSKTSSKSREEEAAAKVGIAYAHRHVFLDNNNDKAYILGQLNKVEKLAHKNGYAIAIGHPKTQTYAALKEWLPKLSSKKIKLMKLSEVVKILNPYIK
jgi:DNA-binding transcriptional regulator WhiA